MTLRDDTWTRPSTDKLAARGMDGSVRFDLIVIPDRFKGPMSDISKRIGGLQRVTCVHLDPATGRFSVAIAAGGVDPRRVIGEVCAMGCVVCLVPTESRIAA